METNYLNMMHAIFGGWHICGNDAYIENEEMHRSIDEIVGSLSEKEQKAIIKYSSDLVLPEDKKEYKLVAIALRKLRHPSRSRRVSKYFIPQLTDHNVLEVLSAKVKCMENYPDYEKGIREDYELFYGREGEAALGVIARAVKNKYAEAEFGFSDEYINDETDINIFLEKGDELYSFSIEKENDEIRNIYTSRVTFSDGTVLPEEPDYYVSPEEEECQVFSSSNEDSFRYKLKEYMKYSENDNISEYEIKTDGLSSTDAFRNLIKDYIKHYEPECVSKKKNIYIKLMRDGEFVPYDPERPDERVLLSAGGRKKFNFICFLNINRFWNEAGSMKNANQVKKPLFVKDFLGTFDAKEDTRKRFIDMALSLGRQVLFTDIK